MRENQVFITFLARSLTDCYTWQKISNDCRLAT